MRLTAVMLPPCQGQRAGRWPFVVLDIDTAHEMTYSGQGHGGKATARGDSYMYLFRARRGHMRRRSGQIDVRYQVF